MLDCTQLSEFMVAFNMSALTERINKLKEENEESTDFTHKFLTCLMERHDLKESLHETFSLDGVPGEIIKSLIEGTIPSKKEINLIDPETQSAFLYKLIWVCGMNAIDYYTGDLPLEDGEISVLEAILSMTEVDEARYIASHIIAAYTLLMSRLPTVEFIESVTNDFDDSPEQIQKDIDMFVEISGSLLTRWMEDKEYYGTIINV
jgi:hypothetical protein